MEKIPIRTFILQWGKVVACDKEFARLCGEKEPIRLMGFSFLYCTPFAKTFFVP